MYLPPNSPFLRVPVWLLKSGANATDVIVYAALLDWYTQNADQGAPNLAWLENRSGIGKRSLIRSLERLEEQKLIERTRHHGTRSGYAFSLPPEAAQSGDKQSPEPVTKRHRCQTGTGDRSTPEAVTDRHQTGATLAPQQRIEILKENTPPNPPKGAPAAEIREVFDHWASVHEKPKAKLTKDRSSKIKARLREGYPVADLKLAVDGCKLSRFHMGENDRSQPYNDLVTILKSGKSVEEHMERAKGVTVLTAKPKYASGGGVGDEGYW